MQTQNMKKGERIKSDTYNTENSFMCAPVIIEHIFHFVLQL